jgi:uncharacterized damage-inducible protein DinB
MSQASPILPPMTNSSDHKATLVRYYRLERDQLRAKLDGLNERDMRWPMVPTGTNLLGLIKHVASVQLGYFGEVFGQPIEDKIPWLGPDAEVNADMWVTADETSEQIFAFWQLSSAHADATIHALDLEAQGAVPWWPEERQRVTLQQILVHTTVEISRHAGHADIVRELIDGRAGNNDRNLPDQTTDEWATYRSRIEEAAEAAARRI